MVTSGGQGMGPPAAPQHQQQQQQQHYQQEQLHQQPPLPVRNLSGASQCASQLLTLEPLPPYTTCLKCGLHERLSNANLLVRHEPTIHVRI